MKNPYDVWSKIDEINAVNRIVTNSFDRAIRALIVIADNDQPSTSRNIARNTLEDIGLKVEWDDNE